MNERIDNNLYLHFHLIFIASVFLPVVFYFVFQFRRYFSYFTIPFFTLRVLSTVTFLFSARHLTFTYFLYLFRFFSRRFLSFSLSIFTVVSLLLLFLLLSQTCVPIFSPQKFCSTSSEHADRVRIPIDPKYKGQESEQIGDKVYLRET